MPYWQKIIYWPFAIFLIFACVTILMHIFYIGFEYEYKKFYQLVVTVTCVILFQYIILEHVMHSLNSYLMTQHGVVRAFYHRIYSALLFTPKRGSADYKYNELTFWRMRVQFLKSHLELHFPHRNESVNWEYKSITSELWLFVKYYILLLLVIVGFRNTYIYYNNRTVRTVLTQYRYYTYGLNEVQTLDDMYEYINTTLIKPFNGSTDYYKENVEEPGWLHFQLARLIGVVRLKQVRQTVKKDGMRSIYFSNEDFLPNWTHFSEKLHYLDLYWRMHHPWLSREYTDFNTWLFGQQHYGSLYTYWEDKAYIATLVRDVINNVKILTFLKDNNWLDELSVALFIEFTLYNVDSNIFTICSLVLEQSPFAMVIWDMQVSSAQVLTNLNDINVWWWLLIFVYALQTIQFAKAVVLKAWYDRNFTASIWNWLDLIIIFLSVLTAALIVIRNYWVLHMLKICETSKKLEFIDFRLALFMDYALIIVQALLVTVATIRIWRILQFSRTFRLFTRTLHLAAVPLLISLLAINIFLIAISLATEIVNGSHTANFARYFTSVTSIMSFSFGFNSHTSPEDLSHGGNVLGFILYIIVMFAVAILLINLFIILILNRFKEAREDRDKERRDNRLTYPQYLYAEGPYLRYRYKKCSAYHRNINKKRDMSNNIRGDHINIHALRMEHTQDITEILLSQMEILGITIMDIKMEDDVKSDIENVERNILPKNLILKLNVMAKLKLFTNLCIINRIVKFLC